MSDVSDDIVKWLRHNQIAACGCGDDEGYRYGEAAAEILRLRALLAASEAEAARLRGEVADLADTAPCGLSYRGG